MALQKGSGKKTLAENIDDLVKETFPADQAAKIASKFAEGSEESNNTPKVSKTKRKLPK